MNKKTNNRLLRHKFFLTKGYPIVVKTDEEKTRTVDESILTRDYPIVNFLFYIFWICGIVIAPGWWKLAALFPPYAFYVFFEKIMQYYGVI